MDDDLRILFLCGIFGDDIKAQIVEDSRGPLQYAANRWQHNFLHGLSKQRGVLLNALSAPFIGAYPQNYKNYRFDLAPREKIFGVEVEYVEFNNIWGVRHISRQLGLTKKLEAFAKNEAKRKCIIVYSPHTPFLEAAIKTKKFDPSIHICLIVPDLPQFMNLQSHTSAMYRLLKKIDICTFNKLVKHVDSFVLLTEQMNTILNSNNVPYQVVEGMVIENKISYRRIPRRQSACNLQTVTYTGTLNRRFGVMHLVKAFTRLDFQDVQLVICGAGECELDIMKLARIDRRIQYLGQISPEEVSDVQNQSTILVNPRQNNEEFTKYSFPSKNMEYLLSGRPVIAYKLDGIPAEYDNLFVYVKGDSVEALTATIREMLLMPESERVKLGANGRAFVLDNKNSIKVCADIIDMISSTFNDNIEKNNV